MPLNVIIVRSLRSGKTTLYAARMQILSAAISILVLLLIKLD